MVTVDLRARAGRARPGRAGRGGRAGLGPRRRVQPAGRRRGIPGHGGPGRPRGITTEADACSGATLTVAAGEPWDDLVAHTVAEGGRAGGAVRHPRVGGATPIQNVGAYGAEVADWSPRSAPSTGSTGRIRTFFAVECGFGYRTSRFKHPTHRTTGRALRGHRGDLPAQAGHPSRRRSATRAGPALGIAVGERAPAAEVRAAVLALRAGKGMVLADDDRTPGAPARSSPTRCCPRRRPPRCRPRPRASPSRTAG